MGAPCCPAAVLRAATSFQSATKEPSGTQKTRLGQPDFRFPKSSRILRSGDFRKVYSEGVRVPGRCFTAFCLARTSRDGPKIVFTLPRALGKSVLRNRMKRRLRESVRLQLSLLGPEWAVVFNPRRATLTAPFDELCAEVRKVFERCGR